MTLIQVSQTGSLATIVTGDTRRTIGNGKIPLPNTKGFSKIRELSQHVLVVGGGLDEVTDFIYDEFKKYDVEYIDQAIILRSSVERALRRELGSTLAAGICAQTIITGFTQEGRTAYIKFETEEHDTGEFTRCVLQPLEQSLITIAPDDYAYEISEKIMKDLEILTVDELVVKFLERLAAIQFELWKHNSLLVSEIFQYQALCRDLETGAIKSYKGEVNLKETKGLFAL